MSEQRFSLVDGEPAHLVVRYHGMYKDVVVSLGGVELARTPELPENEIIGVDVDKLRVIIRRVPQGLEARVDQRILEGSATHPVAKARGTIHVAALLVALQPASVVGVWLQAGRARGWPSTDAEVLTLAALATLGLVSLVLAWRIARRSSAASLTAVALALVHTPLAARLAWSFDEKVATGSLVALGATTVIACIAAPLSMNELRARERTSAVGAAGAAGGASTTAAMTSTSPSPSSSTPRR